MFMPLTSDRSYVGVLGSLYRVRVLYFAMRCICLSIATVSHNCFLFLRWRTTSSICLSIVWEQPSTASTHSPGDLLEIKTTQFGLLTGGKNQKSSLNGSSPARLVVSMHMTHAGKAGNGAIQPGWLGNKTVG